MAAPRPPKPAPMIATSVSVIASALERRARRGVAGDELGQAQLGMRRRDRLQVMDGEAAERRMVDDLRPDLGLEDLVARPQLAKARAALEQRLDERAEGRIVVAAGVLGPEAGERVAPGALPLGAARLGVGEQPPEQVGPAVGRAGGFA